MNLEGSIRVCGSDIELVSNAVRACAGSRGPSNAAAPHHEPQFSGDCHIDPAGSAPKSSDPNNWKSVCHLHAIISDRKTPGAGACPGTQGSVVWHESDGDGVSDSGSREVGSARVTGDVVDQRLLCKASECRQPGLVYS